MIIRRTTLFSSVALCVAMFVSRLEATHCRITVSSAVSLRASILFEFQSRVVVTLRPLPPITQIFLKIKSRAITIEITIDPTLILIEKNKNPTSFRRYSIVVCVTPAILKTI